LADLQEAISAGWELVKIKRNGTSEEKDVFARKAGEVYFDNLKRYIKLVESYSNNYGCSWKKYTKFDGEIPINDKGNIITNNNNDSNDKEKPASNNNGNSNDKANVNVAKDNLKEVINNQGR
jgi:hypothetical protein